MAPRPGSPSRSAASCRASRSGGYGTAGQQCGRGVKSTPPVGLRRATRLTRTDCASLTPAQPALPSPWHREVEGGHGRPPERVYRAFATSSPSTARAWSGVAPGRRGRRASAPPRYRGAPTDSARAADVRRARCGDARQPVWPSAGPATEANGVFFSDVDGDGRSQSAPLRGGGQDPVPEPRRPRFPACRGGRGSSARRSARRPRFSVCPEDARGSARCPRPDGICVVAVRRGAFYLVALRRISWYRYVGF
jgi:hypothetical protein